MAITYVGGASAASNTVNLPSFIKGDVAIVVSHNTSTTIPSIPSGWKTLKNGYTNVSGAVHIGYRILQTGDSNTGTWTNATDIGVAVFRGAWDACPLDWDNYVTNGTATSGTSFTYYDDPYLTSGAPSSTTTTTVFMAVASTETVSSLSGTGWTLQNSTGTRLAVATHAPSSWDYPTVNWSASTESGGIAFGLRESSSFPVVSDMDTTSGTQTSNSTSWTLTYPTNIAAGDLLLVIVANDGATTLTTDPSTDWSQLSLAGNANGLGVSAKIAAGTETGTFTHTGNSEQGSWMVLRIPAGTWYGSGIPGDNSINLQRDSDGLSILGTVTGSPNSNPDPPSLNPANWDAENTLWFAVSSSDTSRTYSAYPSSPDTFTNTGYLASGGSTGATLAWARLEKNAASVDPGTFTHSASDDWIAVTIAIRPRQYFSRNAQAQAQITGGATQVQKVSQAQTHIKTTYRGYAQSIALISTSPQYSEVFDAFGRSVSPGWGTSDNAGAWEIIDTGGWSVTSGEGRVDIINTSANHMHLSKMVPPTKWKLTFEYGLLNTINDGTVWIRAYDGGPAALLNISTGYGKLAGVHIAANGSILFVVGFGNSSSTTASGGTYASLGDTWVYEGYIWWEGGNVKTNARTWNKAVPGTVYTASQSYAASADSLPGHLIFETQSLGVSSTHVKIDNFKVTKWMAEPAAQSQAQIKSTYPRPLTTYAEDTFTRTLSNDFGTANIGGSYTENNPNQFSVSNGLGVITESSAGQFNKADLGNVSVLDVDIKGIFKISALPTVDDLYTFIEGRQITANTAYRLGGIITPTPVIDIYIGRSDDGPETVIGARTTVTRETAASETFYNLRFQLFGTSPTTLRGKIWQVGTPEPDVWDISTTDSTTAHQQAGGVGLGGYAGSSITNLPYTISYDYFGATSLTNTGAFAQSNAHIKIIDIESYAQTQTLIKQTYSSFAQSQAQIKQIYQIWAQSNSNIQQTYNSWAQAQSHILTIVQVFAQANASIIVVNMVMSQAQTQINTTYQSYAQAQTQLKLILNKSSKVVGLINGNYFMPFTDAFNRSVADGLGTSDNGDTWSVTGRPQNVDVNGSNATFITYNLATIKAILSKTLILPTNGLEIGGKVSISAFPSSGSSAIQFGTQMAEGLQGLRLSLGSGQTLTLLDYQFSGGNGITSISSYTLNDIYNFKIQLIPTSNRAVRRRAKIWKVGDIEPGFTNGTTRTDTFVNIGAPYIFLDTDPDAITWSLDDIYIIDANWTIQAQSQAKIKQTYNQSSQAQTQILTTYQSYAQTNTQIKTIYNTFAQTEAQIISTYQAYAQAQTYIKAIIQAWAQAEAQIYAPATIVYVYAQSQALVQSTVSAWAQTNTQILQTYAVYAQAQSHILITVQTFAQANAGIIATSFVYAQAGAQIKTSYQVYAQSGTYIKSRNNSFAQAAVWIKQTYPFGGGTTLVYDTFTESVNTNLTSHTPEIGGPWVKRAGATLTPQVIAATDLVEWTNITSTETAIYTAETLSDGYIQAQLDAVVIDGPPYLVIREKTSAVLNYYSASPQAIYRVANGGYIQIASTGQGSFAWARFQATGTGPTSLKLEGRNTENALGTGWSVETTDNAVNNQVTSGYIGIAGWYNNDEEPFVLSNGFDNFKAISGSSVVGPTFAQSQARIKQTYNQLSQVQAEIKSTYQSYAQSQAEIKQTYYLFAQSQADILATQNVFAQAQTSIVVTTYVFAQAQTWIVALVSAVAQSQATLLAITYVFAQSQAYISGQISYSAQAQAQIITAYQVFAQAQGQILQAYQSYAQTQGWIENTYSAYAQANAWIKLTDNETYAQAMSQIKQTYLVQAQADAYIKVTEIEGFAQAQAQIKVTYQVFAQNQAQIKQTYVMVSQANAWILQAYSAFAQATTNILNTYQVHAQAQTQIKQTYGVFAQAQTQITQVYAAFAQANAWIQILVNSHSQAQTDILQTYQGYAQVNAWIEATYQEFAQAQSYILMTGLNVYAQAGAIILQTYAQFGQANTYIATVNNVFAQAQAQIYIPQYIRPVADISNDGWRGVVI